MPSLKLKGFDNTFRKFWNIIPLPFHSACNFHLILFASCLPEVLQQVVATGIAFLHIKKHKRSGEQKSDLISCCFHKFPERWVLPSGWKPDQTSQEGLGPSVKLNSCGEATGKSNHSIGIIYSGWLVGIITERNSPLSSPVAAWGPVPDICKAPFSSCDESFTWDVV